MVKMATPLTTAARNKSARSMVAAKASIWTSSLVEREKRAVHHAELKCAWLTLKPPKLMTKASFRFPCSLFRISSD